MRRLIARLAALPGMTPAVPFMVTSVLILPVAGAGLAAVSPQVAAGTFRTYPVLAANHLVTLGWGTLLAMGSIHQMFPAMLGVPRRPGRGALVQYGLSLAGMAMLVCGLLLRRVPWIAVGGLVSWTGIVYFLWLTARMIPQRRRWTPEASGVTLALGYLLLAATWGLLMALNWRWAFWPGLMANAGPGVHAALGLGGWFVQLVISVSAYLLPRFVGLHRIGARADAETGKAAAGTGARGIPLLPVLLLLNAGVLVLVAAALAGAPLLARGGAALMAASGLLYAGSLLRVLRARQRARPDLTIHHWWAILGQTVLLSVLAAAWAGGGPIGQGRRVAAAAVVLLLAGWLSLAIMGQLYKVTPFLMWYYRFALGIPPAEVPRLEAPYYPAAGVPAFYLSLSGSLLLTGGVLFAFPTLATAGSLLFLGGGGLFAYVMAASWIRAVLLRPGG
ncbi:MAG: hypothetical protein QN152_09735 [Armatimonadota bacterium]|nr:hypothetical protein [Armatimonadota bacterium]MDR7427689.1 hypothetical protein [Armatimonadota bacterium]MDR7463995.1 hypothetical protein [Armatimonadota bacterium]MDR7470284.1 hypothetical protein [Armatimonadota bacterium]MDR7475383.1 hypothetical protein [Armatimonadota bacterium]